MDSSAYGKEEPETTEGGIQPQKPFDFNPSNSQRRLIWTALLWATSCCIRTRNTSLYLVVLTVFPRNAFSFCDHHAWSTFSSPFTALPPLPPPYATSRFFSQSTANPFSPYNPIARSFSRPDGLDKVDRCLHGELGPLVSSKNPANRRLDDLLADIRRLPSTLGKLACLSAHRDPYTAVYLHPAVADPGVAADLDREFRLLHERVFRQWLNLSLEEQKGDLDLYFSSLACGRETVIRTWATLESYRSFMPITASTAERQLYLSNMVTLIRIEIAEFSGAKTIGELQTSDSALLTIKEASEFLRVPPRTLRLWAELGEIPALKTGRQWRFRRRDIEDWLARPIKSPKNR